jgi:hypothetical protein
MDISIDQELALIRAKGAVRAVEQLTTMDLQKNDQVTINREYLGSLMELIAQTLDFVTAEPSKA